MRELGEILGKEGTERAGGEGRGGREGGGKEGFEGERSESKIYKDISTHSLQDTAPSSLSQLSFITLPSSHSIQYFYVVLLPSFSHL